MKDINHNRSFFSKKTKEPLLNVPLIILALIVFCFCIYFIPQYCFSYQFYIESLRHFSFIPVLFRTEPLAFFYTILSYSFMHSNFQHVAINMAWLVVFGSPLVKHLGAWRFLIFWIVTAIIAVLTYFVFHQDSAVPLVGASGAVSGMMGAIARYGFPPVVGIGTQNKGFLSPLLSIKKALRTGNVLIFMGVWLGVDAIMGVYSFLLVGEGVSIAWEAHIGGFCSGFLLIGFFDISRQK